MRSRGRLWRVPGSRGWLHVEGLHRVGDQRGAVVPEAVDRAAGDPGAGRDAVDRERAVPALGKLVEGGLEDRGPRPPDPGVLGVALRHGWSLLCNSTVAYP